MALEPLPPGGNERDRTHAPFMEAVNTGDVEKVRTFLKDPKIDVNYVAPKTGLTALHIAAGRNALAVLKLLASSGRCDFTIKDAQGRTAAEVAVVIGDNPATGRYLFDRQSGGGIPDSPSASTRGRASG